MNKTPKDYPQVKFRLGEKSPLEKAVLARSDTHEDKEVSRVSKRDLERYYLILPHLLPTFSEHEALVLVSELNGMRLENDRADKIWSEVENKELRAKLESLSFPECMAVLDAVQRFWSGAYSKSEKETQQKLREVGLVQ